MLRILLTRLSTHRWAIALAAVVGLAGCGTGTYEQKFTKTLQEMRNPPKPAEAPAQPAAKAAPVPAQPAPQPEPEQPAQ